MSVYHYVTGLFDGSWWSVKVCARCDRAWSRARDRGLLWGCHQEDDGPAYGELVEWIKEERHHARWLGSAASWSLSAIEAVRARREHRRAALAERVQ